MAEISTKFGKNLKRIRTAKKLSQGAISRKLKVHRVYINRIENGGKNPSLITVHKVANALGVSVNELLK